MAVKPVKGVFYIFSYIYTVFFAAFTVGIPSFHAIGQLENRGYLSGMNFKLEDWLAEKEPVIEGIFPKVIAPLKEPDNDNAFAPPEKKPDMD